MKIVETVALLQRGAFAESAEWRGIRETIHAAIKQAEWPVGAGSFAIYPESGKKSGEGNGVVPIKLKPMQVLKAAGWELEFPWEVLVPGDKSSEKGSKPGNIDAAKLFAQGLVVVEWETGNISSSHRAVNKMALGLVLGKCVAGVLVVPNMNLARYLTDRIGNIEELRPYAPLYQNLAVENAVLELVVIEQDSDSKTVPKIPKGNDGRAKAGRLVAKARERAKAANVKQRAKAKERALAAKAKERAKAELAKSRAKAVKPKKQAKAG